MQGYALIHWAAYYGYTECIEVLIKHGANILLNTMVFCCGSDFRCRIKSQLMILQQKQEKQKQHNIAGPVHCLNGNKMDAREIADLVKELKL